MRPLAPLVLALGSASCNQPDVVVPAPVEFARAAIDCVATEESVEAVFDDEAELAAFWTANSTCSDAAGMPAPPPEVNFVDRIAIVVLAEGGCAYSGCPETPPELVDRIDAAGSTAVVKTKAIDPASLGLCNACYQPGELVTVARADLEGLEVVFD